MGQAQQLVDGLVRGGADHIALPFGRGGRLGAVTQPVDDGK